MLFTATAVGAGLLVGLLAGGRVRHLSGRRFRIWPLLPVGVALQLPILDALGGAGLIASYVCLLVFALANLRLVGMGLVALGILLNLVPITLNDGMPVDRQAVVRAGITSSRGLANLHLDRKHHLDRPDDHLSVLSDIIPVSPLGEVLSFGDVVLSVGVADVLFHLLRPRLRHARAE